MDITCKDGQVGVKRSIYLRAGQQGKLGPCQEKGTFLASSAQVVQQQRGRGLLSACQGLTAASCYPPCRPDPVSEEALAAGPTAERLNLSSALRIRAMKPR